MPPPEAVFGTWQAADGWALRRMDWPQPGGKKRGSLIFAGGRGDFIEKYLEAFAWWHAAGWTVTAFDWRGQGRSRGESTAAFGSFDPLVDDCAALLADWRSATPAPASRSPFDGRDFAAQDDRARRPRSMPLCSSRR